MSRQATIRNLRSKGITVLNTLKVCLMILGFAWVLYQFKYSHQKTKTDEEKSSKVSLDRSPSSIPEFCKQNLPHSNKTQCREFIGNQSTEGDNKNGGIEELRAVENEQLEDTSRAAREDSLKGDDASSEVVAERGNHLTAARDSSAHELPRENTSKPLGISEQNNSDMVPKGNQTLLVALNKASSQAQNSTTTTDDDDDNFTANQDFVDAMSDASLQTANQAARQTK